jgi:Zn-dependent peptidase ImmA (M78 family)/DNA-binding XRE family transcriptional regulator
MVEIPVSGAVLTWARKFRGLSIEEAADRLGLDPDELAAIESEVKLPTLTKFEKMAAAYRLPLATLFRRTPPQVPEELPDFRTFEGAPPQTSFEFRVALSNVRSLQATLRILRAEDEHFRGATLRQYEFGRDPFEQGEAERRAIGVTVDQQLKWDVDDGFRHWRAIIERLGISVYLQNFELTDCRGCSLLEDGITPAILINKTERSENGWVFTLIHEYAHLLIRRPGISDLNRRNPTEAFCNRFAAAFLMPVPALKRVLPIWPDAHYEWDDRTIRDAARWLKVSPQALAIRLEELGRAPEGLNRRFVGEAKIKKPSDGGNYINTRLSEIGGRYTEAVIGALDRDVIDNIHASQALTLKPSRLDDARAYVERQRELASAE